MLWQITQIVFPIFAIVLVGYLYGRRHAPDMAAANKLNIDIFVPALIFDVLTAHDFQLERFQLLALAGSAVILGAGLVAWPVARWMGYQPRTFVPPMMFNNSGNMGLPLMLFAFGEEALAAAVVLFLVENFLHFSVGMKMLDRSASMWVMLKIPMIFITLLGLLFSLLHWQLPEIIATPIKMLGQIAIPLMLFALGVRLIDIDWKDWKIGLTGALVSPISGLVIALPVGRLLDLPDLQYTMLIVFSALPPAVLNYMVAERYQQQPHQVASIVMLGNLGAIIVIPLVLAFTL